MQDKASGLGLALDPRDVPENNCLGPYTDSYTGFLKGAYARINPKHFRSIGATQFGKEIIDESVRKRCAADAAYAPQNAGFQR
jgi:hypothetical protein